MIKLVHFADAHIDIATHGKRDAESGLPYRVLDFLKALDTIVDTAIAEKTDLVIFAGDAYKDRQPAPTFQREWGNADHPPHPMPEFPPFFWWATMISALPAGGHIPCRNMTRCRFPM